MSETNDKILEWIFECEDTGVSSKAMAAHFAGFNAIRYRKPTTPSDPSDFNRCLKFLKWVPECKDRLGELKAIGKDWEMLVNNWAAIEECFLNEAGFDWTKSSYAPKTYHLMKAIGL